MHPIDTGFIFALRQEAVGILDRLKRSKTTRGDGWTFYTGKIDTGKINTGKTDADKTDTGKIDELSIAVVLSGAGQKNAEEAARRLIDVFEPKSVCSAGYAGGLSARLKQLNICVPEQVIRESDGEAFDLSHPIPCKTSPMSGKLTLITVNDVVETPEQKRALHERTGAEIVDMETFAIANVCQAHGLPFFSFRVVLDTVDDQIPQDIAKVLDSMDKGLSRISGTILGNIWSRPSVVLDFVSFQKRAFSAAERLAQFALAELSRQRAEKPDLLEKAF